MVYRWIGRPLLFRLDAEQAHRTAETALRVPLVWKSMRLLSAAGNPRLRTSVAGIDLPTPLGLAAGLDKECRVLGALLDTGFGFVTGGTVTLAPREGNPGTRIVRLPERNAIVNSLGFPGPGLEVAERRLARFKRQRDRIFASVAGTIEDEVIECHRRLQPLTSAVELNISSPNTAGLQVFHERARLRGLVEGLAAQKTVPLFVKLPPWTRDEEVKREVLHLAETAVDAGADGLVVANTRPVEHPSLGVGRGGLSGAPLTENTMLMVAEAVSRFREDAAVIACGGVSTAEHVWQLLATGASAVQLYTAFIYEGPGLPGRINRGLLRLMDRAGVTGVSEIEGAPPV